MEQRRVKVTRAIDTSPPFRAALCEQNLGRARCERVLGFRGGVFKQASGLAFVLLVAEKSRSGGPMTAL
eukprot:2156666-Pyramimonas_sp.AAC.1